ncbi:MAG TPA: hypothetical protein VLS89_07560, partial [Candidatus Nanopelagicales bacterium]|nr:hypothetical protein [Candidatus Nanopelagicales bacterium]
MHRTSALSAVLVSIASLFVTAEALATDPAAPAVAKDDAFDLDRPIDWRDHRVFVGGHVGVAWPTVEH